MSRIFEALEKAAADRATLHDAPDVVGTRAPAPSSRIPPWWKASLVGIVAGFVVAVAIPRLLERQQSAASLTPTVDEDQSAPHDAPSGAPLAEAPFGPTALPILEADVGLASEVVTATRPADESPDHMAAASPALGAPDAIAARSDVIAPSARRSTFSVQVGAFKNRENAVRLQAELARRHHPATIHAPREAEAPYVVHAGRYPDRRAAEAERVALAREGFAGFVVPGATDGIARSSFAASIR